MRRITKKQALKLAKEFDINLTKVSLEEWTYGLNVELEHGSMYGSITNVTHNNLSKTAQIALAHLMEYPDYYCRLYKMEKKADKYWKNKEKDIFN